MLGFKEVNTCPVEGSFGLHSTHWVGSVFLKGIFSLDLLCTKQIKDFHKVSSLGSSNLGKRREMGDETSMQEAILSFQMLQKMIYLWGMGI